ncbi:helix-turn-helix domain-containing protein [Paractinoplanes rishiriensis]|uniref:Transcriptional regulator n=1 Tax=Paractinoplanes rishiriensis TaxID=1050105 RepID=A0A919JTY3_9ACTN|nr:helix-turn-helix transcriptional regulator [Actinoplanes rishiriensis]GIE95131.1 transcriptional regulator [Actinoplanes rishiriensis]
MTAYFGEHPAVARRRVRRALREARHASGRSQSDVADRLGWSLSKVQRIESGEVAVSGTDLRALIDLYGGISGERFSALAEDARLSRRSRWLTRPEFRDHLTPGTIQLMGFEASAKAIRVFQPVVIPGPLQTPAVAEKILQIWNSVDNEDRIRVRTESRVLRRKFLLDRENPPDYRLVLDESVLSRDIGGAELAADQMVALEQTARRPNVHIRILPLDRGVLGLLGGFTLVDLDDEDTRDAVLYRESWDGDQIIDDPQVVATHRAYFEDISANSLNENASLSLIMARAAKLRAALDREDAI